MKNEIFLLSVPLFNVHVIWYQLGEQVFFFSFLFFFTKIGLQGELSRNAFVIIIIIIIVVIIIIIVIIVIAIIDLTQNFIC